MPAFVFCSMQMWRFCLDASLRIMGRCMRLLERRVLVWKEGGREEETVHSILRGGIGGGG
eukprot:6116502-Pyramimonas_sp.AAC.1